MQIVSADMRPGSLPDGETRFLVAELVTGKNRARTPGRELVEDFAPFLDAHELSDDQGSQAIERTALNPLVPEAHQTTRVFVSVLDEQDITIPGCKLVRRANQISQYRQAATQQNTLYRALRISRRHRLQRELLPPRQPLS